MKINLLSRFKLLLLLTILQAVIYINGYSQTAITAISTTSSNVATVPETTISGAGYSFSSWLTANTYTVNYSSAATGDITSISSFNTATSTGLVPVPFTAIAKVQRVANATITDTRNFISSWNKISSGPAAAATSGTFNCVAPKVTSIQAALLTNNINSGYDNIFQNTNSNPHYNNVERIDYIIPGGMSVASNLSQIGVPVFDRGSGDAFKIAAITSIDASNNPTGYSTLISVTAANFSAAGLIGTAFDYTIFVSDPLAGGGQHRPSVRNTQDIRGVYISLQNLGIIANQVIYGYSLFGQDVDASVHTLTNPSTFPTNTNSANILDLVNVTGLYKTSIASIVPVKLIYFKARYENNDVTVSWATAFEQDIRHFIIEKSKDGMQWAQLTVVAAANASDGSSYQFNDIKIDADKNYYRLRTVNLDGTSEYSPVRLVSISETGIAVVKYNSFSNSFFVSSNKPIRSIMVLSANGQRMQSDLISGTVTTAEVHLKKMPPGIYFIRVDLSGAAASASQIAVY